MKPIIAVASLALGSVSMTTLVYLSSNPNALLSQLPPTRGDVEVSSVTPNQARIDTAVFPPVIEATHTGTRVRPTARIQPADANLAQPSEEPTLIACSNWRPLGPAYIESGVGSGEHQVKLLCPAGANAQETFLADGQLHPTKMRLNDWSQNRQE